MRIEQSEWAASMLESKRRSLPLRKALLFGASAAVLALFGAGAPAWSQQLPTGGSVASGSATIGTPQNGTLTIDQSSSKAILNWQSFSIGQGGTVNFNQPNSSAATLNRVLGSTPSSIAGTINAPGTVLLVNPNGIAITKDGVIKTGSFAASTLDIKNSDFLNGNYKFTGNGGSAAVTNAGHINVSDGGFAALLGGQVANSGVIAAKLGKVGLGAGELITLDVAGDGFLSVAVPSSQLGNLVDASGALVTNSGKIRANGGAVFLSAATASNILRDAVNVPGSIRANSVGTHSGRIVINGGAGGRVSVTGLLAANGKRKSKGGSIAVSGASVNLAGKLTANGTTGGNITVASSSDLAVSGNIAAKGSDGPGGAIDLTGANVTVLGALIDASAAGQGAAGGNIAIIATDTASIDGTINAGGGDGGHGGVVETSGEQLHVADDTRISTLAINGTSGTWLIDPNDFTIAASGGDITGTTLSANLAGGNVTILSSDGHTAAGTGDIFVNDAVTWSSSYGLTLTATNAIAINANIAINGGGQLTLNTGTTAVGNTTQPNLSFAQGASVSYAAGAAGTGIAGQALTINSTSYTLVYSMAQLDQIDGVAASSSTPAGSYGPGLAGKYALAGSLDASGTTYTDALVGTNFNSLFTGTFEGLGHTITGLTVNKNGDIAGLFGYVGGTLRDIGLIGGAVSGGQYVGGLVGYNRYGTVTQAYATGTVSGAQNVGGLVGENTGTITQAYATGTVRGVVGTVQNIGGLVGYQYGGTITQAYATGAVSGAEYVGGLVGYSYGTITQAYATGTVSGGSVVGGLIGENDSGTATQSYATGAVSGGVDIGGLVGLNNTYISGGGAITQSYATGAVSGSVNVGGLAGVNQYGSITQTYATGPVSGSANKGGLVGQNYGGTVTNGYYDSGTTGQVRGIGLDTNNQQGHVVGLSTAQFQSGALPSGFDSSVWGIGSGLYPYLASFFPGGVQAITGTALNSGGTAASGAQVAIYSDGTLLTGGTASAGANGYFYEIVAAGTVLATNAKVGETLTLAGTTGVSGLSYTDAGTAAGNVFALGTLSSGLNKQTTAEATYSALESDLGATFGSATYTLLTTALAATATSITATGADFMLNTSLTPRAAFTVAAHGNLSVDQAVSAGNAAVVLSGGNLTIGRSGSVTSTASNNAVVLAAGANFINNAGGRAVETSNGRWLIYSAAPDSDTFGNLDSGKTAIWDTAYPAPISAAGNRYVFAYQPTLTMTSTGSLTKIYGDDATAAVAASSFTVSGVENGVTNAFVGDTAAAVYSGAPVFTSAGSSTGANASATPYNITGATGTLRSLDGYAIAFVNNGTLTINRQLINPTSQVNPPSSNTPPNPGINITFQNATPQPVTISFTPPVHVASNPAVANGNDLTPAALPDGGALATNNGFVYLPINQFDANQYSQFKLPDYVAQAGEAAVFAMIARAADARHAADDLIDTFWNGMSGAWTSPNAALMAKVTFSDAAGNTVVPTGHPGFPIVAGKTDLAQMLKIGPVMIGDGGNPVHWLLATQMTADGKGIVANDPVSGKQIVLRYDPASKTVGGVTGVFDSNQKTFVSLANAFANPSADTNLSTLQSFMPAEFLAVTVK